MTITDVQYLNKELSEKYTRQYKQGHYDFIVEVFRDDHFRHNILSPSDEHVIYKQAEVKGTTLIIKFNRYSDEEAMHLNRARKRWMEYKKDGNR